VAERLIRIELVYSLNPAKADYEQNLDASLKSPSFQSPRLELGVAKVKLFDERACLE